MNIQYKIVGVLWVSTFTLMAFSSNIQLQLNSFLSLWYILSASIQHYLHVGYHNYLLSGVAWYIFNKNSGYMRKIVTFTNYHPKIRCYSYKFFKYLILMIIPHEVSYTHNLIQPIFGPLHPQKASDIATMYLLVRADQFLVASHLPHLVGSLATYTPNRAHDLCLFQSAEPSTPH